MDGVDGVFDAAGAADAFGAADAADAADTTTSAVPGTRNICPSRNAYGAAREFIAAKSGTVVLYRFATEYSVSPRATFIWRVSSSRPYIGIFNTSFVAPHGAPESPAPNDVTG